MLYWINRVKVSIIFTNASLKHIHIFYTVVYTVIWFVILLSQKIVILEDIIIYYFSQLMFLEFFLGCLFFFKILFIYFYTEGKGGRKRREISTCGCLSCALYWGPGLQPWHVPWLGIEPATLWFALRLVLNPLSHISEVWNMFNDVNSYQ